MSRKRKALFGFSADLAGQAMTTILSLFAVPIIISSIPKLEYGFWLTIGSIMSWIAISDLGIGMALSRNLISIIHNENDNYTYIKVNKFVSTSLVIFMLCGSLFFLIALVVFPYTINWFKVPNLGYYNYKLTYFICTLAGSISLPLSIYSGILEAVQRLALNRNINTISNIINLILGMILIYYFNSAVFLSLALLISVIFKSFVSYIYSKKFLNYKFSISFFSTTYAKSLLSFGGYFQIGKIANTLATNTDSVFISKYLSAENLPAYNFSSKLYQIFGVVLSSKIPLALFSGLSEVVDSSASEKIYNVFKVIFKLLLRIALFSAAFTYFFNNVFIKLWVGDIYYAGEMVNYVLVYLILYETLVRGTSAIIYAFGELRNWAVVSFFESILNVVLSLFLIQKYNIFGLLIATAISRTLTSGLYLIYFLIEKNILDFTYFITTLTIILKSAPTIIFMFLCSIVVVINNWFDLFIFSFCFCLVNLISFDLLTIIKYRNENFNIIFNKILGS